MRNLSRRRLLTCALGGAGGWALWQARSRLGLTAHAAEPAATAANAAASSPPATFVRSTKGLGTEVTVTVAGVDAAAADRAIAAGFAELREIEAILSIYRPDSQVSRLNRDGIVADAHRHLREVLAASLEMARRSDGAFDVTVQPLWDLYAAAQRQNRRPTADEISQVQRKVDWRRIEMNGSRVRFNAAGMALTFNGIAQGYATDRVTAVLAQHGVRHALIDVGELAAIGDKAAGEPWKAGIQHPREPDAYIAVAKMDGGCLATSGDYATTFDSSGDRRDHHIFDPVTGCSPTAFSSVSVVAPTAMQADALSTAVFVLGLERGRRLIEQTPGADALFVTKSGVCTSTPGFPRIENPDAL
jgi:thiamine biosynthesis lipoprotein